MKDCRLNSRPTLLIPLQWSLDLHFLVKARVITNLILRIGVSVTKATRLAHFNANRSNTGPSSSAVPLTKLKNDLREDNRDR